MEMHVPDFPAAGTSGQGARLRDTVHLGALSGQNVESKCPVGHVCSVSDVVISATDSCVVTCFTQMLAADGSPVVQAT